MYAELAVSVLQLFELLLRRYQLRIHQIHLLHRNELIWDLIYFPRNRCFPSNVVQRIFVVCLEVGVFELPSLIKTYSISFCIRLRLSSVHLRLSHMAIAPSPHCYVVLCGSRTC